MLTELPPAADAVDPPTFAGPDHPMQILSRQVAFEGGWSPEDADRVEALFDSLAPEWHAERRDPLRVAPLRDALARGDLHIDGVWLEIGAGTGTATEALKPRVGRIIALDLSSEMLRSGPDLASAKVRGDSSRLPVRDSSIDVVVCVNMFLFGSEIDRVLRSGGQLLWVNTIGNQTPIHLPVADVAEALPGEWSAVTAHAGTGFWAVVTRA